MVVLYVGDEYLERGSVCSNYSGHSGSVDRHGSISVSKMSNLAETSVSGSYRRHRIHNPCP